MPANPPLPATPVLASGGHSIDVSTWGVLEWAGYGSMILVCIWVLWRAVRTTVRPNEDEPDHVKRLILDGEDAAMAACRPLARREAARPPPHPRIPSAGSRP